MSRSLRRLGPPPVDARGAHVCQGGLWTKVLAYERTFAYNSIMPREIVEIQVKSVLNRVTGMPFAWSINPYRGCSHGCPFCYARRTHWFLDEDGLDQWSTKIFAKVNAPEVLRREFARASWRRETVALGTATDPYQAVEGRYRLTRQILESFVQVRNPVGIVTRSPLIRRDVDLLAELARTTDVTVCLSVVTVDASIARNIEPHAAPPMQRLRTVRVLVDAGIRCGVLVAPILPGLTDSPGSLKAVVAAAADHGARFIGHNVLHLGPVTRDSFMRFLQGYRPDLLPRYGEMYGGKYAPRPYRTAVGRMVEGEQVQAGVDAPRYPARINAPQQMRLAL